MVYVDAVMPCIPNSRWPWPRSCHLVADTEAELHAFALRLGLKRIWFQSAAHGMPHYDLTPRLRGIAVRLGAQAIGREEFVRRLRTARAQGYPIPAAGT